MSLGGAACVRLGSEGGEAFLEEGSRVAVLLLVQRERVVAPTQRPPAVDQESSREPVVVSHLAVQIRALVGEPRCLLELALAAGEIGSSFERPCAKQRILSGTWSERAVEPAPALAQIAAASPEVPERDREAQCVGVIAPDQP